ncbi:hypothetical protein DSM106972_017070 [Dulcicalothrix desertica PCC 7102]|uniref:Uncharacterized protein n=1 Tax=Dulcicalothrix desertica PCC 7102 TaxID=232991 RepID=A0A433VR28_9CYAN|nr:hypothetical protein [Dulcicalothrix desertica]RUT08539.1 hypothetical protein DSM106972_017070 [Dulcicalothrix desertica PCC 7102]TWH44019.1 hypothetical protein CAL7102_07787 [Dulcicalothrix desertica PCC 7102]
MGRKNKIHIDHSVFDLMGRKALLKCSYILGVETTRLIKGGIRSELANATIRSGIRRCLGQGTFPSTLERLAAFLEQWQPSTLDDPDSKDVDPIEKVKTLIENVKNNFNRLSNLQKLEILTDWIEHPQEDCCYEELDSIAETLGFSYEEIDEENILVLPSPQLLVKTISSMKNGEFYHSVIALAEMSLPKEEFSNPPSFSNAAYDFLEQLAEYFAT